MRHAGWRICLIASFSFAAGVGLSLEAASAARCSADSAGTIKPAPVSGKPFSENGDTRATICKTATVESELKAACSSALKQARSDCDNACKIYNKLDKDEQETADSCKRDKENSKTSSTWECTVEVAGDPQKTTAIPTCTASIVRECDP